MNIEEIIKEMEENNIHVNDIIQHKNEFSLTGDKDKKNAKHICIGIPINREIPAESFASLIQLYAYLSRNYVVSFTTSIATYLHEGRNLILQNMVDINKQQPIDYMLWIDSDTVHEAKHFDKMLKMMEKKNLDVLSGLYFTKRSKACKPVFLRKDSNGDYRLAENYPINALLKVDGIGFGYVLMRANKILPLHEKYGSKMFMILEKENTGRLVGEDVVFSRILTAEGIDMYVWTDIVLGHEGGVTTEREFWARQTNKDDEFKQYKEVKTDEAIDNKV